MKQRINRMPPIDWIRNKRIPEKTDIILIDNSYDINYINLDEANVLQKESFAICMNKFETPKIYMMTSKFYNGIVKTKDKLLEDKIFNSLEDASGVLILEDFIIYYQIGKVKKENMHDFVIFAFTKPGKLICSAIQDADIGREMYCHPYWREKMRELLNLDEDGANYELTNSMFTNAVLFELFKRYAEVQIKVLAPKINAELFRCKYYNETDHSIEIMDSTWFTELIISESFNVRGHFRLQPYGTGLKERKLVWITDFKKKGYTRKAKMESELIHN